MSEHITVLIEAVLVFAVVLVGLRIMLGRATVPVLICMGLCALSTVFPNDPSAQLISCIACRLAVPALLLWGLYHLLTRPSGEPPRGRSIR